MNVVLAYIKKKYGGDNAPQLVEGQKVEEGTVVDKKDVRKVKSMTDHKSRYIVADGNVTKDDYLLKVYCEKTAVTDIAKYAQSSSNEPWDDFLNSVIFKKLTYSNSSSGVDFDGKYYTTGKNGKNKSQKYKLLSNTLTWHNTNASTEATVCINMENVSDSTDVKGLAIDFTVDAYGYQKVNEENGQYVVTNEIVTILDGESVSNVAFKPYDIQNVGHDDVKNRTENNTTNYFVGDNKVKDKKDFEKVFYSFKRAFNARAIKTDSKALQNAMEKYHIDDKNEFVRDAQQMGSIIDSCASQFANKASSEDFDASDEKFQSLCAIIKSIQRVGSQNNENEDGSVGTTSASAIDKCLWLCGYTTEINGVDITVEELINDMKQYI